MTQQVRIIGGKFRGKKLAFPPLDGLRPTTDRIKETLFNWLMHYIRGSRCLDAFAGSGALGFEAFSRGAHEVVLIEKSMTAYHNLQHIAYDFKNVTNGDDKTILKVIHADAIDYLKAHPTPFDIIFVDPPFAHINSLQFIELIQQMNAIKPEGLLYLEAPNQITLDPTYWTLLKSKRAGNVYYALYKFKTLDKAAGSCFNQ